MALVEVLQQNDGHVAKRLSSSCSGCLKVRALQSLCQQMLQAAQWMHIHNIVHRDLKTNNFLVDCVDINDEFVRLFLCDFGTACRIQPGERLRHPQGTHTYW